MSTRAIRKLRGETSLIPSLSVGEGNNDDGLNSSDDEDEDHRTRLSARSRVFLLDDDDDDDTDSSDSGDGSHASAEHQMVVEDASKEPGGGHISKGQSKVAVLDESIATEPEEEDLDAILSEFQAKDTQLERPIEEDHSSSRSPYSVLLEGLDPRDLDIDLSMRTSLMGGPTGAPRKNRQAQSVFGNPREGWPRPPHYVGGGIGMTSYDRNPTPLPWPYCDSSLVIDEEMRRTNQWYSFIHSDTYMRDLEDYRAIQSSGDINALVLFVAHHPFVAEALLQLSEVLYQTNHGQEGLSLLRRCLWVLECSTLLTFFRELDGSSHLDVDQPENVSFFESLFRLIRVSANAGLPRTALSSCRLLLSLDPLRDPMGTLLMMDHFALSCRRTEFDHWLIRLVDSNCIRVWYRDPQNEGHKAFSCGLLELPNWAFSYALALHRVSRENDSASAECTDKANEMIQNAASHFPNLVCLLLHENDVDTTGRSMRRDWVEVLKYLTDRERSIQYAWGSAGMDSIALATTLQAVEVIGKIFVMQSGKLWGDDDVLQWLFNNLVTLKLHDPGLPLQPNPGIMRYSTCKPAEFDHRIQQLPPDANVIDPNLVAYAMVVDPNRRRFLRREARNGHDFEVDDDGGAPWAPMGNRVLAGPPTNVLDPDWPMMEIFLRSFLPWNRVEGVPPPR